MDNQELTDIDKLKERIFNAKIQTCSVLITDHPDIVNYNSEDKSMLVIINNCTHTIKNVTEDQFMGYVNFLHNNGMYVLR